MVMAATVEWFAGQDGTLTVGDRVTGVTYHSTLNSLLVTTKTSDVQVLDVTSGVLLQKSDLSAPSSCEIQCVYLPLCDKVLFCDGDSVCLRKDLSGVLLLDTALQSPVQSTEDVVKIELPLPEANHLYKSLMSAELPGIDFVEDVLKELENEITCALETSKDNHKVLKWATVCLKLPHSALKSVCHNLMMELKRLNQNVPALPVASAITERLNSLVASNQSDNEAGMIDFSLMYSEAARRDTFIDWPHMNYKWALPDPMAQAGFFHQPNATGDDRARCFICNVCLVCWEPTDEPWSEHERHSPTCPFVKGEYTRNVPLSVTHATQLAVSQGYKIECVGTTMSPELVATSSLNGNIVVWNVSRQLKKELQFNLDPSSVFDEQLVVKSSDEAKDDTVDSAIETKAKSDLGEATPVHPPLKTEPVKLTRPSQDVLVSSLCILAETPVDPPSSGTACASPAKPISKRPSLLIGGAIRKNIDSLARDASVTLDSDVETMNEVNQAMSVESVMPIITDEESAIVFGPEMDLASDNPFTPCLLIHSVSRALPAKARQSDGATSKVGQSSSGTKKDMYMTHNMVHADDDVYEDMTYDTVMPGTNKFSTLSMFPPSSIKFMGGGPKETASVNCPPTPGDKIPAVAKVYEEWLDGTILQCVRLPEQLRHPEYCISSITPTYDGKHVIVVVSLRKKSGLILVGRETNVDSGMEMVSSPPCSGCILVYEIKLSETVPLLNEIPVRTCFIDKSEESIRSVFVLPRELGSSQEEDEPLSPKLSEKVELGVLEGQFAVITKAGLIRIYNLATLESLTDVSPADGDTYVSLTYCNGVDRLCAATDMGKLHFLQIGPRGLDFPDGQMASLTSNPTLVSSMESTSAAELRSLSSLGLLVDQRLTTDLLQRLHELTLFENLMPRYSATLPPCWYEIQQEQQQRRHPQHLQQQGELLQHTRTWKLQQDSTSWSEHLLEIALPRPSCIGHIDMKFSLHPLCTDRPHIEVTLLSQNVGKIGRKVSSHQHTNISSNANDAISEDVTDGDNNIASLKEATCTLDVAAAAQQAFYSDVNNVSDPEFLAKHNAEILCGPLDLMSQVDLSSQSGLITLTSPQLLKTMSRSFLIHIKALLTEKEREKETKPKTEKPADKSKSSATSSKVVIKSNSPNAPYLESFYTGAGTKGPSVDQVVSSLPRQKLEDIRGCDWLHEVSVTIRKPRKTSAPTNSNRFQRVAMLDSGEFHRNLVHAVCRHDDLPLVTSLDHRQGLALDILCWITAIQVNEPQTLKSSKPCAAYAVQSELLPLVRSCFIHSGRTVAHKCAKLLVLCIRFMWNSPDKEAAPLFNRSLLQALLVCLPGVLAARSAGAVRWFFTLLNHVKSLDVGRTAEACAGLLSAMSTAYAERMTDLHAVLRTRFGLYGNPCEPSLFDVEPLSRTTSSPTPTPAPSGPITYAQAVGSVPPVSALSAGMGSVQSSSAASSSSQSPADDIDFKDLLSLSSRSSARSSQCNDKLHGLLEVEPLHFVCHATSDGTKMEKLEPGANTTMSSVGSTGMTSSGVMSFINHANLPPAASAAGAALSSLSSAMASAEQQLQQLQLKTTTLMKLQQQKAKLEQKLAESKGAAILSSGSTSLSSTPPGYAWHDTLPPTPKSTPLFMTPPVTPPNESQVLGQPVAAAQTMPSVPEAVDHPLDNSTTMKSSDKSAGKGSLKAPGQPTPKSFYGQASTFLQQPTPHVLVIERMHSGARRFVVLDFGHPILLTDVLIPSCADLASLSIDTWCDGEETDGQRLVIAQDISSRSLVMKDLLPSPMCRYLKITTVGRYGAGTSRSRIPIGSFYGHSFILPWEAGPSTNKPSSSSLALQPDEESRLFSQLGLLMGLQEDIQCRYNLACSRVNALVSSIDLNSTTYEAAPPAQREKSKEDKSILQALNSCAALQLQLNQASRAIERLQGALGIPSEANIGESTNLSVLLRNASSDKLRVLTELLLDILLRMTHVTPSIPCVPKSLYLTCDPAFTERLFKSVCIVGTRPMQVSGGMLLLRVCHGQPWWGEFLGNILLDLYSSEQTLVFPKDRVFILLSALGQRSLVSNGGSAMIESLMSHMTSLLTPLQNNQHSYYRQNVTLDLPLVTWMLLFLSRILDNTTSGSYTGNTTDDSSAAKSSKDGNCTGGVGGSTRWDFLQGEGALQELQGLLRSAASSKLYRRKLHKRLLHHKQQLLSLEQAKKKYVAMHKNSKMQEMDLVQKLNDASKKAAEALLSQNGDQVLPKQLKQHSAKHLKDIIQIRRTDGDLLRKLPKDGDDSAASEGEPLPDLCIVLPRDKCLSVIRGLVALVLALDFSCNVDLFLVACKVIAKITMTTRPAISLSEAMTQEQLEKLILLCANVEYNHGNISWGGPWAGHAIVCLLQDILEGEKLYPPTTVNEVTDDETSNFSESEGSQDRESPSAGDDEDQPIIVVENGATAGTNASPGPKKGEKYDKETSLFMDLLLGDAYDNVVTTKLHEYITGEPKSTDVNTNSTSVPDWKSITYNDLSSMTANSMNKPNNSLKEKCEVLLASHRNNGAGPPRVSTALDARLEYGVDCCAELRLKFLASMEAEEVHNALVTALPPSQAKVNDSQSPPTTATVDDSLPVETSGSDTFQTTPSGEMLSLCFDQMFSLLQLHCVNVDTILKLWLALNDDVHDDGNTTGATPGGAVAKFETSRVPSIQLNHSSVTSLLAALAWSPEVSVHTWVLAFQALTLLSRRSGDWPDRWVGHTIINDPNFLTVLLKFMSSLDNSPSGNNQTGPVAVAAFNKFITRFHLRCDSDGAGQFKELLLRLVYKLCAAGGAFSLGQGPLDAQCKLLEHVLEQNFDTIDTTNAISVIEVVTCLVHRFIMIPDRVTCRSSADSRLSARRCFAGILNLSNLSPTTGDASHNQLLCSLLRLVNMLVQVALPGGNQSANQSEPSDGSVDSSSSSSSGQSMTDNIKIHQRPSHVSKSDEEKMSETDEQKTEGAPSRSSSSERHSVKKSRGKKRRCLSDMVLGHEQIMTHLLQALSHCGSVLGSNTALIQDAIGDCDPVTVGDGVFQILSTLNAHASDISLVLRPIMHYLSSGFHGIQSSTICRLSEPLYWLVVHVLDCEEAFDKFLELGAVQIVCQNLVNSSRRVVNAGPSLISTIMQHFGNSNKSTQRKRVGSDSSEELINYAPLGTITSSSPTAGPADILIQSSPPHRRARTAAWSYHFYPEENWIDLTIQLPCPVLLREVHVQPHISSLATSPHSVVVEVSPNSSSPPVPVTAPLPTTGLSNIRLDLNKPEVACVVTIRLQKPRDTSTLGLAQIMLVGSTAFSWTSKGLAGHDDIISGTSVCWLRLLHHFLVHNDTVAAKTALAAASTPNLLKTCTALMLAQSQQGHFSEQAKVALLKMGLHRAEMGLAVIDSLLRNSTFSAEESVPCLYGKTNGAATDATVDLLYALGVHQDEGTEERVRALCDWLGDTARVALQHSGPENEPLPRQSPRTTSFLEGLPNPSPAHVHCVAAVLWHSVQLGTSYSLGSLVTRELLSSLYEWSMTLPHMSALKKSVDAVICSLCHVNPSFFSLVLEWMGIAMQDTVNLDSSLCDDQKDSQRQISHDEHMTDDSKEACQGRTTDLPMPLHDFSLLLLDETHLTTLGMACRSTFATSQLLRCGFPAILAQALVEFCSKEISRLACTSSTVVLEQGQESVGRLGNIRSPRTGKRRASSESVQSQSDKYLCLTADLVAPVLYLLTEAANEPSMKDWLGEPEGHVFWSPLLNMLCNTPVPAQTAPMKIKVMSDSQRAAVEAAAVTFFRQVVASHSTNQLLFAQVLCDVIRGQDGGNHSPLSGFTRRVFLQVLLEDEKVALVFSSTSDLFKDQSTTSHRISLHPRYGAGHNYRVQSLSLQTTCGEVVAKLADKPSFVKESGNGTTTKGETKSLAKDTNEIGLEMVDLLSAAAGYQAKEKRDKDKANKSSALAKKGKTNDMTLLKVNLPVLCVYHHLLQGQALPSKLTLSQLLVMLHNRGIPHGQTIFHVTVAPKSKKRKKDKTPLFVDSEWRDPSVPDLLDDDLPAELLLETPAFQSPLQVFASIGGLSLLAEHLPLLYPEITRQAGPTEGTTDNGPSHPMPDWVTVESAEDIYDDPEDVIIPSSGSQARRSAPAVMPSIPPHSLVAFGLLLRLPGYAEVLLKERRKAQCLLRLVLGVTDDGDGGHILTSPIASSLPALPFHVLRSLLDSAPLTTDDGVLLRRMMLEIGALHLLLACLSVLSHHAPRVPIPGFHQEIILAATQASTTTGGNSTAPSGNATDERGQHYWAKGTGFGTGSTTSSWDAHQALLRQKSEEEHVTCLLQVLASYINPGGHMPKDFESPTYHEVGSEVTALPEVVPELLSQSCLIPSISSYLRNDSVLDMARHVPLYRALLELLRGVAACHSLTHLLLPLDRDAKDTSTSVSGLLEKMKQCVDTYANRLKGGKNGKKPEDEESEGLALLIPDIQETARISHVATERIKKEEEDHLRLEGMERTLGATAENQVSTDEKYMEVMKEEQFDTFEMVSDEDGRVKFLLSHHYESYVKAAGEVGNPARARRLAQEAVTLSTSLPLSASTTLFVRCDEDRLDVMKVLITGPSETPYANGCFEFDVFFPQDYPNSPPLVNLETTGNHTVRFNPNLYNDGKVCLSVLNTWHGRPEEKWNAQTSSFLQVLVSIQSLILVAEPYFNEPGYERSRGTPSGNACSREYDANIRQATVRWAMLEQLRNPSKCFREVIQKHFWLKRQEICTQINGWIAEMESVTSDKRSGRPVSVSTVALKRHFNQLKEELAKMTAPDDLEEFGAYSPDGATAIESSRGKFSGINKDGNTSGAQGGNSKVTWGGTYSQEASSYGNEDDTDSNSLEFKMDLVDQLSKNNNSLSPYVEMVVFDGNDVDNIENDVSLVSTFGSFTGSSDGPPPPDCEDMIVESDTDTGADDDLVTAMATAQQTVDSLSDDAKITADALNGATSAECDVSEVSC